MSTSVGTYVNTMGLSVADSSLFRLSGELRNEIYRHYFGDDKIIPITADGVPEPALLLTCRTVRKEALSLFYHDKRIEIHMHDYDSNILLKWESKCRNLEAAGADGYTSWSLPARMQANRLNLCRWLWRYYHGYVTYSPAKLMKEEVCNGMTEFDMVRALFDTLSHLKAARVPGKVIVAALQPGLALLQRHNSEWKVRKVM